MNIPPSATLEEMQVWAESLMASRAPDFVIGADYLRRWFVVPRNPWANTSFLILGGYIEHTPQGSVTRRAGDVISRWPESLHRLEVIPGERAISLFITGPKVRDWGFACPQGWVPWQAFTDPTDSSQTGRGCGE